MAKKRKSAHHKKKNKSEHAHHKISSDLEHALLQNLIELQKVNTNLAEKFDHLSKEISQLLALFELTARSFAKNAPQTKEYQKDKDFLEKIDRLLEQNKLLAKGLTIMEEHLRERMYGPSQPQVRESKPENNFEPSMASRNRPLPRF